jgi:hypothetical protein
MEYFGFSILLSDTTDVAPATDYLKQNIAGLQTPAVQISHWHKDNIGFKEISLHYPDEVWFDGIALEDRSWANIYQVLHALCPQLQGKLAIEYQHEAEPHDPYYMLVFDKNGISLGDDSQWEETLNIEIIETSYKLPTNNYHAAKK